MDDRSDSTEKSQQNPKKHRRGLTRIAAACERCRKRKQKCDNNLPTCGPCEGAGAACTLSNRLTVHVPECECDTLRSTIANLQSRIDTLTIELSYERQRDGVAPAEFDDSFSTPSDLVPPQLHVTPQPPPVHGSPATSTAYSGRILRPTFIEGNSHRGVSADVLGSVWHLWRNDASTETPGHATTSIHDIAIKEYGDELIDVFFDNYWAHLPILHRPTFYNQHYSPVSQGATGKQFSEFQVFMVFAIAACEKPKVSKGYLFSHRDFFQRAIKNLAAVMATSDLDCIQCLLLLCIYGRNEPQSVNMWHTTGLALRTALGIDLHRSESVASDNLYEAEMAKRLFWAAYVLDRSMALAMGRPLGVEDIDITVPFPLRYTDDQLINPQPQSIVPFGIPDVKDTSTFIHVIKIRRINANVYKTFHSAASAYSVEDLETLRSQYYGQLHEWLVSAPHYFLTKSMFQSVEWFQIAYHHAILALHRPSNATPVPSPEALRLCADSSISLISSYASLYAKNKVSYSFIALNSIFMAAVTMLYALRASPFVRQELSKQVTEANVTSCLSLFRGISRGREIAERCATIVSRLGKATLALFDRPQLPDEQVDMEFLSWFGLRSHHTLLVGNGREQEVVPLSDQDQLPLTDLDLGATPSVDGAWRDFFAQGLDWEGPADMDFFLMPLQ